MSESAVLARHGSVHFDVTLVSLLATLFWPPVEMQDDGIWGYVNVHNKRKTRSNPIFCDEGLDVKVDKVRGLNRNFSGRSHPLFRIVKSLIFCHNCVC